MTGVLKIQTTREFGESTVSRILDSIENTSSRKSRSEDFISKFSRIYTPAVCYAALAIAILPPLMRIFFMRADTQRRMWIYRVLTFLVISCFAGVENWKGKTGFRRGRQMALYYLEETCVLLGLVGVWLRTRLGGKMKCL